MAGLDSSRHHNKARDCLQITLEGRYKVFLGLYLVQQRHLVSIFCPYHFVHIIFTFYSVYSVIDSQTLSTIIKNIDNKLYLQDNLVVSFFLVGIIGLLVRYSPARTSESYVVFTIIGVTASLIRQ